MLAFSLLSVFYSVNTCISQVQYSYRLVCKYSKGIHCNYKSHFSLWNITNLGDSCAISVQMFI